jgi:hypothetical protein
MDRMFELANLPPPTRRAGQGSGAGFGGPLAKTPPAPFRYRSGCRKRMAPPHTLASGVARTAARVQR